MQNLLAKSQILQNSLQISLLASSSTGGAGFIGFGSSLPCESATVTTVLVLDKLTYAGDLESLAPGLRTAPRYSFVRADIVVAAKMARRVKRRQRPGRPPEALEAARVCGCRNGME